MELERRQPLPSGRDARVRDAARPRSKAAMAAASA